MAGHYFLPSPIFLLIIESQQRQHFECVGSSYLSTLSSFPFYLTQSCLPAGDSSFLLQLWEWPLWENALKISRSLLVPDEKVYEALAKQYPWQRVAQPHTQFDFYLWALFDWELFFFTSWEIGNESWFIFQLSKFWVFSVSPKFL